MNEIEWVIESERDLAIYLNIQQYTTVNIRRTIYGLTVFFKHLWYFHNNKVYL